VILFVETMLPRQVATDFEYVSRQLHGTTLFVILLVIAAPKILSRVFDDEQLTALWQSTPDSYSAEEALKRGHQALARKRYHEAEVFFRKAADTGDASTKNYIGILYAEGRLVPRDYAQAMHWLRRAADLGDVNPQNNIGDLYANGHGVPRDYEQARYWYNLAAAKGNDSAKSRLAKLPAN
jgi:TPR repeat protein